jgi:diguanylate cyclase (GGDEF)-like protein
MLVREYIRWALAMVPHWRLITGPLITLAVAGVILLADRYLFNVPNPGAISFLAVAFAAYLGGVVSGLISAAISLALAAVLFSLPGALFDFTPDNFGRLVVLGICTPAIAVMIGVLQARAQRALEHERAANRELAPLRAALDQSEIGVILLDSEMRAQFINRAFRRLWRLPDEIAARKPAFVGLMYHGRDAKAFAVPPEQLDSYVAEQTALIRTGNERPVDIRLASGDVIRRRCKVLADGGRMLTYGNVSDLVRSADEMAELAMTDALTGIYNRRHFMARLDDEWKRFRRYERPLSLLFLDIDHFKSINDRYGHGVGDQIIIAVARLCGMQTRDSDLAARIGGEEFAILLPETGLLDARIVAERLRLAVAKHPLASSAGPIAVTVSIGTACADSKLSDLAILMARADEALYAAKRGGRNCVAAALHDGPVVFNEQDRTAA